MRSAAVRMVVGTVLTGLGAGVMGVLLTLLLHLVQHVSFGYTENTFLTGVERASSLRRVLALLIGGVLAGVGWWLRRRWVDNEAVSVTQALRAARPRLTVPATLADAVLQIVAVGAGASMGREGAPRQAAAAIAGWIGEHLGIDAAQQRTLVACGAGAGLAAVYNVPLGGAAFTLEVLLGSLAFGDLVPAAATAGLATVVAGPFLGDHSTYRVPPVHLSSPVLVWVILCAPVTAVAGVAFRRLMTTVRTRAPIGWASAASTVIAFGALGALAIRYPQLLGNGKGLTGLALDGTLTLTLAAVLVILKPLATAACLGAGAIGGLLTPALATGAALGVLTGRLWSLVWPGASTAEFAMIGAAMLLAVTLKAPVTAVVLTLEFTGTGLPLLAPMVLGASLASLGARVVDRLPRTAATG